MKAGILAVTIGMLLLGFGIFMIGDRSGTITGSAYVVGFVLLSLGIARLVWAGWHGRIASWFVAALPAAIFTWALYELIRHGIPLLGRGVFGEMTAPILSAAVAVGMIAIAGVRFARSPDTRER